MRKSIRDPLRHTGWLILVPHLACSGVIDTGTGVPTADSDPADGSTGDAGPSDSPGDDMAKLALGPGLSFQLADGVWAGLSGLIGSATVAGTGEVVPPAGFSQSGGGPYPMKATVGQPAVGASVDMGIRLIPMLRGKLGVGVHPTFLSADNGTIWVVPISIFYEN